MKSTVLIIPAPMQVAGNSVAEHFAQVIADSGLLMDAQDPGSHEGLNNVGL